jgi:hypothetical protein
VFGGSGGAGIVSQSGEQAGELRMGHGDCSCSGFVCARPNADLASVVEHVVSAAA